MREKGYVRRKGGVYELNNVRKKLGQYGKRHVYYFDQLKYHFRFLDKIIKNISPYIMGLKEQFIHIYGLSKVNRYHTLPIYLSLGWAPKPIFNVLHTWAGIEHMILFKGCEAFNNSNKLHNQCFILPYVGYLKIDIKNIFFQISDLNWVRREFWQLIAYFWKFVINSVDFFPCLNY